MNRWELPIDEEKIKTKNDYDLEKLYEHAHSELSLQQTKRDQIITIYLALCSFLVPFTLGEELISWPLKGLIFIAIGIVGVLFSFISVRYREYKEVYWLCCQSITVLKNLKPDEINKDTIQQVYYHCLFKKGKGYVDVDKMNYFKYVKKNLFSSETLYFAIISLMTSFVLSVGVAVCLPLPLIFKVVISAIVLFTNLAALLYVYFRTCIRIYMVLAENDAVKKDQLFSKSFAKAWFLHMYY